MRNQGKYILITYPLLGVIGRYLSSSPAVALSFIGFKIFSFTLVVGGKLRAMVASPPTHLPIYEVFCPIVATFTVKAGASSRRRAVANEAFKHQVYCTRRSEEKETSLRLRNRHNSATLV